MSVSQTRLGRLFQSLGTKQEKDLPPTVDFDVLGTGQNFEIAVDVKDYMRYYMLYNFFCRKIIITVIIINGNDKNNLLSLVFFCEI